VTTPTRPSSRQPSCYSTASALAPTGNGLPTSGSKSPGALPACTSTTVLTASQPTRSPLKFAVAGIAMLAGTSALLLSYVLGGSRWTLVGSTAMGVGSLVFVLAICWYLANTPGDQDDERRRCESAVQIHVVDERYLARLIKHRGTSTSHGPSSYLALHATWPDLSSTAAPPKLPGQAHDSWFPGFSRYLARLIRHCGTSTLPSRFLSLPLPGQTHQAGRMRQKRWRRLTTVVIPQTPKLGVLSCSLVCYAPVLIRFFSFSLIFGEGNLRSIVTSPSGGVLDASPAANAF